MDSGFKTILILVFAGALILGFSFEWSISTEYDQDGLNTGGTAADNIGDDNKKMYGQSIKGDSNVIYARRVPVINNGIRPQNNYNPYEATYSVS